ncbi:MAG: glycosyltransferase [Candidatus Omnitrophica bacterium]|nr:glycosyltransferase [Candidatus Omnitrophota bacterium]
MRVLHIIVGLNIGGAEFMLKRLIESDPVAISSSVVVSLTSLGEIGESLRAHGVCVHTLSMSSALDFPIILWRLVKLIRQYQPNIVQTWMYHADLLGGLAARLTGHKNIIWGIRRTSLLSSNSASTVLVMKICALLSRWVPKKIICVAEATKQPHIAVGYDTSRMVVIPNGFDFSHFTATIEQRVALRQACHFSENNVVVGCVGRFHPDKGQDNFVKAATIVARSYSEVKFLLVGRDCDVNNTKLIGWLNEYGLQDRFVLLGERSDVPVCLAAMDVFCMPSRTEGFPNGLGEAMAMGLPCVATNVGDTAVLAGNTAVLVPAQDEQALAQGILGVIALSDEQRYQMGQLAKVRVINEFTIDKACARFNAVYQEILSGAKT